tara:strand:- start:108 stop:293 length:186 start_codon:yes stop_codon:yes gene_type:complete
MYLVEPTIYWMLSNTQASQNIQILNFSKPLWPQTAVHGEYAVFYIPTGKSQKDRFGTDAEN